MSALDENGLVEIRLSHQTKIHRLGAPQATRGLTSTLDLTSSDQALLFQAPDPGLGITVHWPGLQRNRGQHEQDQACTAKHCVFHSCGTFVISTGLSRFLPDRASIFFR